MFYLKLTIEKSMSDINLYSSLIELGLKDFLKTRGHGKIIKEKWAINLDVLVSKFTEEQKEILKNKINKKKNETHAQHNDVFHELSIACAFYDNVNFLKENKCALTPDFCSGSASVEVKTINNSNEEKDRLSELNKGLYCEHRKYDENFTKNFKKLSIQAIIKKFNEHIQKAQQQLGEDGGHIWVVYAPDSPPSFNEDEQLKLEIENKFKEIVKTVPEQYKISYIHFGDLRDKLEKTS